MTQEGHEGEVKAQEEQGEEANSLHEGSHVSDRHMTWWRNAWWVRVNNGPHLQTARDRRRVWRAATRAAQEVRDTGKVPGGEREKWEQGKTESNTLHVIFHFNPTAAAAAASAATVRLQWRRKSSPRRSAEQARRCPAVLGVRMFLHVGNMVSSTDA